MKFRLFIVALIIAMLVPFSAAALEVTWSGSYDATGVLLGEDFTDDTADKHGVYQSIRLAPSFDFGNDVKMHVGLRLFEDYWSGDHRKPNAGGVTDWDDPAETLGLDYGYIEMPFAGGKLSVGRQKANWGHGLTTSDDRRDRIAYQYDIEKALGGPLSLLALYDLRQFKDLYDMDSYGHLVAAAAVGYNMPTKILWGLLGGYFIGDANQPQSENPFMLDSIGLVGPYMDGPVGPVDLKFAAHTLFPIANDRDTLYDRNEDGFFGGFSTDEIAPGVPLGPSASGESGGLYNTFNFAAMIRPALDFSKVSSLQPQVLVIEAQGLFVFNGSLVSPGFDSFSSMIGNAGRNTVNPAAVFSMGGFGYEDDHQLLGAARVNYELIPGLNAILAGGVYHFFEYKRINFVTTNEEIARAAITNFFADVKVKYAVSQQASLYANYGWLGDDTSAMYDPFSFNPGEGDPRQQFSAGVELSF
jgi:hypothetical protein